MCFSVLAGSAAWTLDFQPCSSNAWLETKKIKKEDNYSYKQTESHITIKNASTHLLRRYSISTYLSSASLFLLSITKSLVLAPASTNVSSLVEKLDFALYSPLLLTTPNVTPSSSTLNTYHRSFTKVFLRINCTTPASHCHHQLNYPGIYLVHCWRSPFSLSSL